MFPQRRGGDIGTPVQGEIDGGEALCEVSRRVLSSTRREGGEGWWEPGRGRVRVWGGAGHPEGGQASSVSAVWDDRGEAVLSGQEGGGGRKKVVRCPSLDSMPEAVHAPEGCNRLLGGGGNR